MNKLREVNVAKASGERESDLVHGLTTEVAKARIKEYGLNKIVDSSQRSLFLIFLGQFKSPIVYLLLVAAGLSFYFQEWLDAMAILLVILINAAIGFYMEYQASRSMNALKKLTVFPAKVLRDGRLNEVDSEQLVPGDLVYLEAGDVVLADGLILKSSQALVNESTLTGESIPIEKSNQAVNPDAPMAERTNMLFKGTYLVKGNAWLLVTATGMKTELGKIANMVQTADQAATPLERKLQSFSITLIKVTVGLLVLTFVAGLVNSKNALEMLTTSIALAVAAIPEGLPIVATIALAQGMMKMARHQVIVKKLSAVETLGGTNMICTDKTGTLTQNKIEVAGIFTAPNGSAQVLEKNRTLIQKTAILCSTADLVLEDGKWKEIGDPLETGLLSYVVKQGQDIQAIRKAYPKIQEEPFSSETKLMATLHQAGEHFIVFAKGATEEILQHCDRVLDAAGVRTMDERSHNQWLSKAEQLSASGLRVIAAAYKEVLLADGELVDALIFTGLVGLLDPPRSEVNAAIRECRSAGISVVMITGDHPFAAKNIALQLDIASTSDAAVITGAEMTDFDQLDAEEKERWARTYIFARVNPKQKLDLVRVFQEQGNVVGMTGDGVNDAPALKKADIGIAMGKQGTQVAQEVADMVLKDDSFTSIVKAIRQGRIIAENIRKFIIYLLSCNLSELLVVASTAVFDLHFQLFPIQILFINMVTDVLPALALGVTRGNPNIMKKKPQLAAEPIIDSKRWAAIIIYASVISAASLGAVFVSHLTVHKTEHWNPELCNNILFFTLIFSQLLHAFNMGQAGTSFFQSEVVRNKYVWAATFSCLVILAVAYTIAPVRNVLSIYPLSVYDGLIAISAAALGTLIMQLLKSLNIVQQ